MLSFYRASTCNCLGYFISIPFKGILKHLVLPVKKSSLTLAHILILKRNQWKWTKNNIYLERAWFEASKYIHALV